MEQWIPRKDSSNRKWILLIVMFAFAIRLYGLDKQSLWFDEIVIVFLARLPWYDGLVAALGQGMQFTPFFQFIIKLTMWIGHTDWLLRLPAAMLSVLSIPMIYKLGQRFFDEWVGLLAAFCFAINPYQVWYGQELKLYTLIPVMAGGSMLAFAQLVRTGGRRGLGRLILFNFIGFPTHYFMFLISTVQFIFILIRFRQRHVFLLRWTVAQLIGVLPLIPWWLFIIQQQHFTVGIGWIPRPDWFAPILTFWNFAFAYDGFQSGIKMVGMGVMLLGLGFGLWQVWQRSRWGSLLTLWLFLPPLITLLLSLRTNSFYVDRYLLEISPILTLLTIAGLLTLPISWGRWATICIFLVITAWGLWQIYFDRENFSKEDWRAIALAVDSQAQPEQIVVTCTDGHWLSFEYYNPHHTLAAENVLFASQIADISYTAPAAWIVAVHDRLAVHYLSKTIPPQLNRSLLRPEVAAWEMENREKVIIVPGISAYKYRAADRTTLAEITQWHCQS